MVSMRKRPRKRLYEKKQKEEDTMTAYRDWAGLPEGLVEAISDRVPLVDTLSMGNVCDSWRRAVAGKYPSRQRKELKRGFPWLVLWYQQKDSEVKTCFSVLENKVCSLQVPEALGWYCWGAVQDWLIIVNEFGGVIEISFYNPFSRTKLLPLPKMLSSVYSKVVCSTSPAQDNFVVLLIRGSGIGFSCWTPGHQRWQKHFFKSGVYYDSVFCGGCFYFLGKDYSISSIDAKSLISLMEKNRDQDQDKRIKLLFPNRQVETPESLPQIYVQRYMVESCSEVLLVCRVFDPSFIVTHTFEVYKLDAHRMIWRKMESLGDRVIFIGKSVTRSFSSNELGADIGNCIFFFKDQALLDCKEWEAKRVQDRSPGISSSMDWTIFSLDTNRFIPSSGQIGNRISLPPVWITAPLWWYLSDKNPL